MNKTILRVAILMLIALFSAFSVMAQDDTSDTSTTDASAVPLPASYYLQGFGFEYQGWNNCGPATITNALTFFGYSNNQTRAANWLKPDSEDKNVSPWQMVEFVNTQVPEIPVFAMTRSGGTLQLMKSLLVNGFPVIIEEGYDPEPDRLGWMGHYLLLTGYDDASQTFLTHDSYLGANLNYSYEHIAEFWQHFNYTYIVLYDGSREAELLGLLGSDADEYQNATNSFAIAQQEAVEDDTDGFAWFNMGTNLVHLAELQTASGNGDIAQELYVNAAVAYDQARNLGLPWRMSWYQFGMFEAYYNVGRYSDMIALAQNNLNDGGGQFVEETFYYGGLAREGLGEYSRALSNYNAAITFNANFLPAVDARDSLQSQLADGG
ncbi:MAG: C39 family peptidase [Anaerolineae bacterium]|nr:C39 family peptidase [Anaerolineae bacterium]MDQ7036777.1 C39 family peptidase [Anaerolineae bacterium]